MRITRTLTVKVSALIPTITLKILTIFQKQRKITSRYRIEFTIKDTSLSSQDRL